MKKAKHLLSQWRRGNRTFVLRELQKGGTLDARTLRLMLDMQDKAFLGAMQLAAKAIGGH